jgi:SAM-dependent methyltransferase
MKQLGTENNNTHVKGNTHVESNTQAKGNVHVKSNAYVKSNAHVKSNEYVNNKEYVKSNTQVNKNLQVIDNLQVKSRCYKKESFPVMKTRYSNNNLEGKLKDIPLKSLAAIEKVKGGEYRILKKEKWLKYLALTSEWNVNLERVRSLEEKNSNYVLSYVEKTLRLLSGLKLSRYLRYLIEETLKWSEVAKSGLSHQRKQWFKENINLSVHNIGSAEIYLKESTESNQVTRQIVYNLILTHGLIGQYIRGEVPLTGNRPLFELVETRKMSAAELKELLIVLNYCIISAVDEDIWKNISRQAEEIIEDVLKGLFQRQYQLKDRIKLLRSVSIKNGENFEAEYSRFFSDQRIADTITKLLTTADLWYVEAALFDFTFEEFIKILLITSQTATPGQIKHISFEWLMKTIYYQHEGRKRVNIYKKRIIEKYLSEITIDNILKGCYKENPHTTHEVSFLNNLDDTVFFNFRFSEAGSKLIDFCIEAEKSDVLYERAIILLFDLFGLRKDKYDRFYEEESYLNTMNQTIDYKKAILDYITGNSVVDIGPGGGALMDLIEDRYPEKKVLGVDIAQNVLDSLKKKIQLENRRWDVLYGDALNLGEYIEKGSVDTIIFCSILHELFSYIEFEGKKFNQDTLAAAFKSVFQVLPKGGRIIIRDGIMTEPAKQKRIVRFLSEEGMQFLERYTKDFKGREIEYTVVGQNEVLMPVNDAMEFLYTYTWGEKSYVHEVNEQFGYFTPSGFKDFIMTVLGEEAKLIEFKHFLQEGYTIALSQKIVFYDEDRNPARLPDSTYIAVIEKTVD